MGKILESAAHYFDLPSNAAAGEVSVAVTGGTKLVVENHNGILEYSDEVIILNAGKMRISVFGSGLGINAMNQVSVVVSGKINTVSFE
ncbi:MAG: YabP/YqfC family sporulation protein [Oscillospiraceae bacterium]|nr:YabP/YqfC family sporulation protein [Oscillospiraceae bacterium]MBR5261692.1 YabP/YqfC family sporulation protein [Oscillospiraceae bacterium]